MEQGRRESTDSRSIDVQEVSSGTITAPGLQTALSTGERYVIDLLEISLNCVLRKNVVHQYQLFGYWGVFQWSCIFSVQYLGLIVLPNNRCLSVT